MEELCNLKWQKLLKIFHGIKQGAPDSTEKYNQLKELAKNDIEMTPRQKEGIVERCDNCINGTYGKTKTAGNLSYGVVTEVNKNQQNGKP